MITVLSSLLLHSTQLQDSTVTLKRGVAACSPRPCGEPGSDPFKRFLVIDLETGFNALTLVGTQCLG